jgi:hypothetical protein
VSSALPPEPEAIAQVLERATARLTELDPADTTAVERVLAERASAIEQLKLWMESHRSRLDPDFGQRLQHIFDAGASVVLRVSIMRQGALSELTALNRELALLHALLAAPDPPAPELDCKG